MKHLHVRLGFAALMTSALILSGCGKDTDSDPSTDPSSDLASADYLSIVRSSAMAAPGDEPASFYVATFADDALDVNKPLHVFIAGEAHDMGLLFQDAAVSHGARMREVFPGDSTIFILSGELSESKEATKLAEWGLRIVRRVDNEYLDGRTVRNDLRPFKRIRSIDVYSHSWMDIAKLSAYGKFGIGDNAFAELTPKFTADAYAVFHGCNAGWQLAPWYASLWKIPVGGATTSTNFEQLHSNGNFYFNDEVYQPTGPWADVNGLSFAQPRSCLAGGCIRMRPDNHPYTGMHGNLYSGLGFYKFFCTLADDECERRMALSLLGYLDVESPALGASASALKRAVRDFMCPISKKTDVRTRCQNALLAAETSGDESYSPFSGLSAVCDWSGCNDPKQGEVSTALAHEYLSYIRGIERLVADRTLLP